MIPRLQATKRLIKKLSQRRELSFIAGESGLTIPELNSSFTYLWLRDACQSALCKDPDTTQKLFATSDIALDIKPVENGLKAVDDQLHIRWTDGHTSLFSRSFLEYHSNLSHSRSASGSIASSSGDLDTCPWDSSSISNSPDLFLEYDKVKTPIGLLAAINQICRYGLLFITGVPTGETSNAACEVVQLAESLSEIRETFYGRVWDVVSRASSRNIAYTSLNLGLHMDLLYFQHPPQYQILHCLVNKVEGGQSIFVDSIHAANKLDFGDFETLASTPVPFHYINDGHHLHYEHPTIELKMLGLRSDAERGVKCVNYSPPFQAPLPLDTKHAFYVSLGRFAKLLNSPDNTFRYTLKEGDAVLFDNRRVLHARTAFGDTKGLNGGPRRWLKGCYIESDTLWDKGRVLRAQLKTH